MKGFYSPGETLQLRRPWFRQGTDPEIERWVRNGATLNGFGGVNEWMTGGAGTVMGSVRPDPKAGAFKEIIEREYLRAGPDQRGRDLLLDFLSRRKVSLLDEDGPRETSEAYGLAFRILRVLPDFHFGHEHFTEFELGGWGSGAEKFSGYMDPRVHIFDCMLSGSRRNFMALLLHEIGHSFEKLIHARDLENLHGLISVTKARFAFDYLHGIESRRAYQGTPEEFIAENYLNYVAGGSMFAEFVASLEGTERKAWDEITGVYRHYFGGMAYF